MQLMLDNSEAEVLKRVLSDAVGNLRLEVGDTDNRDLRQELQRNEAVLRSIIARLDGAAR